MKKIFFNYQIYFFSGILITGCARIIPSNVFWVNIVMTIGYLLLFISLVLLVKDLYKYLRNKKE